MRGSVSLGALVACLLFACARADEDVECVFQLQVEDYAADANGPHHVEYGVCIAAAGPQLQDGSVQRSKTLYMPERADYERFEFGDRLFLKVRAKGDESPAQSEVPGRDQAGWKQMQRLAIAKARLLMASRGETAPLNEVIASCADAYPVDVIAVNRTVPSDDRRRRRRRLQSSLQASLGPAPSGPRPTLDELRDALGMQPPPPPPSPPRPPPFPEKDLIIIRATYTDVGIWLVSKKKQDWRRQRLRQHHHPEPQGGAHPVPRPWGSPTRAQAESSQCM